MLVPRVISVGVTPTLLTLTSSGSLRPGAPFSLLIPSAGVTVFIGGPAVTIATGYPCLAGSEHSIDLSTDGFGSSLEAVYGVVAAATQNVNVLQAGV